MPTTTEAISDETRDGLRRLLDFHAEIRRALGELSALASDSARNSAWRTRSAALLAFLRGPLVWHDLDEELLLSPILRSRTASPAIDRALRSIAATHERMEALIEPLAELLARAAAGLDVEGRELGRLADRAVGFIDASLASEEQLLREAPAALSVEDRRELFDQMEACARARRIAAEL